MGQRFFDEACSARLIIENQATPAKALVHEPSGEKQNISRTKEYTMISWAITFLVIALIAAVLGFGGIAGTAISIAQIIFYVAIVLFIISAIVSIVRGRRSPL